ncbi:hypothetical protein [Microbulbifer yueqingensis]|uniref:Uncharacterized protein n=1 Tax=Microbulbifer yueqingensis TaxID=658219 RepID=A0A1G9DQX3_9GAMM|nr:hypothetical protein [Microbulbifer yueqingensis]SDK66287.1 hypothetical protein SAMN05216212_2921 [Microbulbifer yueqingensis]
MAKWIIAALTALLLVTNGFWLYTIVDQANAGKYRQQERYEAKHRIAVLEKACSRLFGGMTREEASRLLGELAPGDEPFEKEGHLNTTWLSLELDRNGHVRACR